MLARAAHLGYVCRAANQPHGPRPCGELRNLEARCASDHLDDDATTRRARRTEPPHGPTSIVGDRWHADPDPRPSTGGPFQELPLSCNAQVLIRRRDLRIVATTAGSPGNRNDPVHYRGSNIEALCQQHGRVLADGGYRRIPELVTPTFRGNRILRDRAWRRHRRRRARVEHAIARLKNWRILRDHRRRGCHLADTLQAVAFLHNLHLAELRDKL